MSLFVRYLHVSVLKNKNRWKDSGVYRTKSHIYFKGLRQREDICAQLYSHHHRKDSGYIYKIIYITNGATNSSASFLVIVII